MPHNEAGVCLRYRGKSNFSIMCVMDSIRRVGPALRAAQLSFEQPTPLVTLAASALRCVGVEYILAHLDQGAA